MSRFFLTLLALASPLAAATTPAPGERIGLVGNGLGERLLDHPWLETELHLRHPDKQLVVRNFCRPGNTAGFRPHPSRKSPWAFPGAEKFHPQRQAHQGRGHHPTPDEWLTTLGIDTLLAFFGYNESFDGEAGLEHFKGEIDAFITHTRAQRYNGTSAPRLILVSPIAYEDLSAERDLPDGTAENERLALYTAAMEEVAAARKVEFIDLFTATARLYPGFEGDFTRNGFLPTDAGYRTLGPALANLAFGKAPRRSHADPDKLADAVRDKNWFWFHDYRMLNGVHVDGRRHKPFGPANYPAETRKLRAMTEVRDDSIHSALAGKVFDLAAADEQTPDLPEVKTNYRPSNKNGQPEYADGKSAVEALTVPEGYKVGLFASEADFPNLANPVQLSFDNRGRLWVATMPSYPHYRPGDERPDDKLLIYEDTDGDGRADKETVFADRLHLPTGFELAPEGVYVAENPHLMLLRDEDGDDRADSREIVLTGFDTHDTHHAAGAFCADPSGAVMMAEGLFLHTGVETPYGAKNPGTPNLAPKGNAVRPTSGLEFVSSSHFPEEVRGDMLVGNTIGFLGIKQHRIEDDGTGYKTTFRQDLLKSSDGNFRPADLEFAPDGSLYIADWQNALIGHMQHSARDPLRDQAHGRIYRITYPSRPLVEPPPVEGAPLAALLENLKHPDYRVRYRTRREIRSHDPEEALPAISAWVKRLDAGDSRHDHHRLEALWATWGLNRIDTGLLRQLLGSSDFRVRWR